MSENIIGNDNLEKSSSNDISTIFQKVLTKIKTNKLVSELIFFEENLDTLFPLKDKDWNKCRIEVNKFRKRLELFRYFENSKRSVSKWHLDYKKQKVNWITLFKIEGLIVDITWKWLWSLLLNDFHKITKKNPVYLQDIRSKYTKNNKECRVYENSWYKQTKDIPVTKHGKILIRWDVNEDLIKEALLKIYFI